MSHLSRMKNPDLLYLSIAAALQAYILHPASLDILATLGTTASLTRTCSPCLINCRVLLLTFCILTIPYVLSLTDHYYIHLTSPPRAIKGIRGIYLLAIMLLISKRDIILFGYLLYLGLS